MIFRARVEVLGNHVHLACFASSGANMTFAKLGDLCCSKGREFLALEQSMGSWEFVGCRGGEKMPGVLSEARTNG